MPTKASRESSNAYERHRYRLKAYGRWQPFVDAEPARQHLHTLMSAGFSTRVIARHLGKDPASLGFILYNMRPNRPRVRRIRPEFAEAILSIRPEDLTPGKVCAIGTARRIQALQAIGWPARAIAPHLDSGPQYVFKLSRRKMVFPATAATVAACYEQLKDKDPLESGVHPQAVGRLKEHARRQGWPDPVWWDDWGNIDDPLFDPAMAERTSRAQEAADRRAEISFLASYGLSNDEIGVRLSMKPASVRDIRNGRNAA